MITKSILLALADLAIEKLHKADPNTSQRQLAAKVGFSKSRVNES